MADGSSFDRKAVLAELEQARLTFNDLLGSAGPADLRRRSAGTRWTNEQLLFHMLFGYIIVVALMRLVRLFGRLPPSVSRSFAGALNRAVTPFDAVNYWGSCLGALVYNCDRMGPKCDRVIAALRRQVCSTSDSRLIRGMYYPVRWDPFFRPYMTLAELYRYPTQHFDFHRRQLSFGGSTDR